MRTKDYHLILFNEAASSNLCIDGIEKLLINFPVWSNFRISDILKISNINSINTIFLDLDNGNKKRKVIEFLNKDKVGDDILLARTANVAWIDWVSLIERLRGVKAIAKLRINRMPSDIYYINKSDLIDLLESMEEYPERDFLKNLFGDLLFNNLERFLDVNGFTFFFRDAIEYYKENMNIFFYLRNRGFTNIYRRLKPLNNTKIVIAEDAVVRDSIIGNGVRIEGKVENSIIFEDVIIKKYSKIENSVILPSNIIDEGMVINRGLVLNGNGKSIGGGMKKVVKVADGISLIG